ncbi:hypothetical protein KFE96_06955 [Kordiimonas sp. SCSIO 12603]|uniref:hypothetical protein n=1 Tax=Kordiimonas sp. SCSIO 12603 TaxID=2829596 RepID=UPI002105E19A|nr:hypothetical protein [Kordiimonas sp. SCSIO 12603]UTW60041.1 hypothetical protein KFE96_06955 [Kordiimonas sp. SCSIO 12603]
MTEKTEIAGTNILSFKSPEARFPKAAVDFVDALLTVQRNRFERELEAYSPPTPSSPLPEKAVAAHILAESDEFIGSGWSKLGKRRDGTSFRWMGKLGTVMLPVDLTKPRAFTIKGCGFTKRRFLKETTLWIDDKPIEFSLSRRGFNRWTFTGSLPAMPDRPFYIIRMQSSGISRLAEGVDAFVSLAVSEIKINC